MFDTLGLGIRVNLDDNASDRIDPIVRDIERLERSAKRAVRCPLQWGRFGHLRWTPETFQNLTKRDRKTIQDAFNDKKVGVDFTVNCKCHECRREFEGAVPFTRLLMGE